jgi:hypothetical protein
MTLTDAGLTAISDVLAADSFSKVILGAARLACDMALSGTRLDTGTAGCVKTRKSSS